MTHAEAIRAAVYAIETNRLDGHATIKTEALVLLIGSTVERELEKRDAIRDARRRALIDRAMEAEE